MENELEVRARLIALEGSAASKWTIHTARKALALLDAKDAKIAELAEALTKANRLCDTVLSRAEQAEAALAEMRDNWAKRMAEHTDAIVRAAHAEEALAERDKAIAEFRRKVSDTAEAALALGHKENCTHPRGYPEKCGCGFGAVQKPLQELILPKPADPLVEVVADAWPQGKDIPGFWADAERAANELRAAIERAGGTISFERDG